MDLVFVGRASDGLVLSESWSTGNQSRKLQGKQLLKRVGNGRQLQHGPFSVSASSLAAKQQSLRGSIDCNDGYLWHYLVVSGIVYMILASRSVSRRAAFGFLDELSREFEEELKVEFGTGVASDYMSRIETIERPYAFVKFDRVIERRKKAYQNSDSGAALQKLNEGLSEVASIMRQNVNDVLHRGEDLMNVGKKSENLRNVSHQFARQAAKLSFQALLQKYLPVAVVSGVFLLVVGWRFLVR